MARAVVWAHGHVASWAIPRHVARAGTVDALPATRTVQRARSLGARRSCEARRALALIIDTRSAAVAVHGACLVGLRAAHASPASSAHTLRDCTVGEHFTQTVVVACFRTLDGLFLSTVDATESNKASAHAINSTEALAAATIRASNLNRGVDGQVRLAVGSRITFEALAHVVTDALPLA
jgi:hypothetical protein